MGMKGEVTTWYVDKGWGFILYGEKQQRIFLHKSDISGYPERDSLPEGEKVKFRIDGGGRDGKPKAIKVKPLSEVESGESSSASRSPVSSRRRRSPSPRYRRRRSPSPRYRRRRRSPPRRSRDRFRPHRPRYVNPRFCLDFKRGDCRYGSRCRFSHEEAEQKRSYGDDRPTAF